MKRSIDSRVLFRLWFFDGSALVLAVLVNSIVARWFGESQKIPYKGLGAILTPMLAFFIWTMVLAANSAFRSDLAIAGTEYYERVIRSGFYASGILAVVGFVFDIRAVRPFILIGYPIGLITHVGFRWLARQNIRKFVSSDKVFLRIIVISGQNVDAKFVDWGASRYPRIAAERIFQNPELKDVAEVMKQEKFDAVYIGADSGLTADQIRELAWESERHGAALWLEPVTSLMTQGRISFVPLGFTDVLILRTVHLTKFQGLIKRVFDLITSLMLLLILGPVFVVVAIIVSMVDGFPVFFRQSRVGRNGVQYRMIKYRTMLSEASSDHLQFDELRRQTAGTKTGDDHVYTKTGKFLRRWSIDELPQLVQVLTGKMSLVGPRPRLAYELYDLPISDRRLRARPGLTGLWQVSGRADLSFAEADALDVSYVDQWSLIGDIAILARTIKAVLTRNGAR